MAPPAAVARHEPVNMARALVLLILVATAHVATGAEFIEDSFAILLTQDKPGGNFGAAVDISGDWAVLASPSLNSNRGVVHAYFFTGWNWTLSNQLTAPNSVTDERFGHALSLHEETLAVGVPLRDAQGIRDSGAVFMYRRRTFRAVWDLQAIISPSVTGVEWGCGSSVAVRDEYMVFGCPNEDSGGRVYLYERVPAQDFPTEATAAGVPLQPGYFTWAEVTVLRTTNIHNGDLFGYSVALALSYDPSDPFAIKYDPHQLIDPVISNYTIVVGSPHDFYPERHAGTVQVFYYKHVGDYGCETFSDCKRGRAWFTGAYLRTNDGTVNQRTGWAVKVDRGVIVAGAPQDSNDNLLLAGSAYVWRRTGAHNWMQEAKLRPDDLAAEDNYGFSLGLFGNASVVCAPQSDPWGSQSGSCYFYLFNGYIWQQATKVTALDHATLDQFGRRVALDTGAVMGSGEADNFAGKVYHFGGYEFFPIPPPVFDPPPGSYLLPGGPLTLDAITGLPSEQVYYEFGENNTNPDPFKSAHAKGHKITLPFSIHRSDILLSAMSANERLGRLFVSFPTTVQYTTWYPTPGYYWEDRVLKECGGPQYYCPGVYEDPNRHEVQLGRYTTPPLDNRTNTREAQRWCEQDHYCIGGVRYPCADDTCWPYPVRVEAAEAVDPALRQPGLGAGDRILITFSTETNQPSNVTVPEYLMQLVTFSHPVGDVLVGAWLNATTLEVTIVVPVQDQDSLLTRLDDQLTVYIHRMEKHILLRRAGDSTQTVDFPQGFKMTAGTWGDSVEPRLIEARAEYSSETLTQNSAAGPTLGDQLVLVFDNELDTTIPANTREEVDALVEIVPRISDIEYVGEWTDVDELTLTFVTKEQVVTYYTDHLRKPFSVGALQVRMRNTSVLRVRDRASPFMRSQELVTVTGSWGDIVRDAYITLEGATSLAVFFRKPNTNPLYNTSGYQMQVSRFQTFDTLEYDTFLAGDVENHNNEEPYIYEFDLVPDINYYVRVFAYNDNTSTRLGPYAITRPPRIRVARPSFVGLLSEGTMPTFGARLTFRINDLGRGPLASPELLGLTAKYNNGAAYLNAFDCSLQPLDGSIMSCTAEAGTGTGFRWTFTARELESHPSPFTTSYLPPVIYFFHKSSPGRTRALTNGSQPIILRGTNFGLMATDNVTHVRYWPNEFPEVVFEAQDCHVTMDHEEITCVTDKGAGRDLRWLVRIANQDSAIISTDYDRPSIKDVWIDNPSNPVDPTELSSRGNETIVFTGVNLGPIRDDVVPKVTYTLTQAPLGIPDEALAAYGHVEFTAVGCRVANLHSEIRCLSFPGFASRAPVWTVHVLGQSSTPFPGDLKYGRPTLLSLDDVATPTQAEGIRVITGLHFARLHALTHTQLLYRGDEVTRERWVTVDDTEIRFRVPHGTGAANTVVLVVNGAHSNTLLLQYELPVLDSVTLKWQEDDQLAMWQVAAGGQIAVESATDLNRQPLSERCLLLRLHGSNFGAMPEMVSITVGGVPCETITLRSHFLVECCTHERRGGIVMVVNEQTSNTLPYDIDDIIPVLRIDSVSPDFGPSIGSQLTIRGVEFQSGGGPMGWVRVTIPGHEATTPVFCPVVSFNDDVVVCDQLPSDARYTPTVLVTVEQYSFAAQRNVSSNPYTFHYVPPDIDVMYPLDLPGRGGIIGLTGTSFGSEGVVWLDTVYGDGSGIHEGHELALVRERCWPVLSWNHTYLACVAPKSAGNATVTVDVSWTETLVSHSRVGFRAAAPAPQLATSAADARLGPTGVCHWAAVAAVVVAVLAARATGAQQL